MTENEKTICMYNYSQLAAKRYRHYMKQKQGHSLIQDMVAFALLVLHALARALQHAGIKKGPIVEKVNVELE
jgi:hypothetical protein